MGELFFCGCLWNNPDHIIYSLATELFKPIYIYMYISKPWARLEGDQNWTLMYVLFSHKGEMSTRNVKVCTGCRSAKTYEIKNW